MYSVNFYEDENGYNEVLAIIHELQAKSPSDKNSRINYQKIIAYLDINRFIILTYFLKKSQKTPRKEIERAKQAFKKFLIGEE